MAPLVFRAFICDYEACDFDDIICCCKSKGEVCCCVGERCLDTNHESLGCGCVTNEDNKECCKIGCLCCTCGLKTPETLCAGVSQCLCIKSAQALPFKTGYVEDCHCAVYCLSCAPKCGCCAETPDLAVLKRPMTDYSPLTSVAMERS